MLVRWLIWTFLLALLPVLIRALIAAVAAPAVTISWLHAGDVSSFGLILAITNISGLEMVLETQPQDWRTKHTGFSLLLVAAFATLFAITCMAETAPRYFAIDRILGASITLAIASTLYSYSLWNRLAKLREGV
jgi:hypothetical protein